MFSWCTFVGTEDMFSEQTVEHFTIFSVVPMVLLFAFRVWKISDIASSSNVNADHYIIIE
jgi:hypothetical protein